MRFNIVVILFFFLSLSSKAQDQKADSITMRAIYDEVLVNGEAYENLRYLCKNIGNRLSGSPNAQRAVEWSFEKMKSYGFDKVWLQEIMVPNWKRGNVENCFIEDEKGNEKRLSITALGSSIGTDGVLIGEVIEVSSIADLQSRDRKEIEGKIVFINKPFDQRFIRPGNAYGACGAIRVHGAAEAGYKGAIAVINRSLSSIDDDFAHTGSMAYRDSVEKIPAVAISVAGSNYLSESIRNGNNRLSLELNCKMHPDTVSYNVIGELTGSEHPEKVMVVGGHLDSWDVGEGAHDDGAGVVQSMEVLRVFKALNIQPKNTLRCVFYMNEENGTRGAKEYAAWAKANVNEIPWVAIESDAGGFSPRGFSIKAEQIYFDAIYEWMDLFQPYYANMLMKGWAGVDIGKLEDQGTVLIGYIPDAQRYFDLHHSDNDVFENVNKRELQLGAGSMASLLYLIDQHGLPEMIKD